MRCCRFYQQPLEYVCPRKWCTLDSKFLPPGELLGNRPCHTILHYAFIHDDSTRRIDCHGTPYNVGEQRGEIRSACDYHYLPHRKIAVHYLREAGPAQGAKHEETSFGQSIVVLAAVNFMRLVLCLLRRVE